MSLFAAFGGALGGLGSALGGLGAWSQARRARREYRRAWKWSRQERERLEQRLAPISRFYEQYFQEPPAWLQEQYVSGLRSALEQRGLAYGGAPAVREGLGLTALVQAARERAAAALPSLYSLPLQFQTEAFALRSGQARDLVGAAGPTWWDLAGGVLGGGLQGAMGGYYLGEVLGGPTIRARAQPRYGG